MDSSNGHRPKVPDWLTALGIKEGEYFTDSKLRAKRAMRSPCFSGPARIHIYLGLATMAFQQELAVKMEAGKRVPVQPADVCEATGIDRRHFRQYMDCLESQGLAKTEGWTKGRFKLYAYAVPRALPSTDDVTARVTLFAGCSPELDHLLRHYRIHLPANFVPDPVTIAELERLARVTKEAEMSLRAYAKCHQNGSAYKEEINGEKHIERNTSSSSTSLNGSNQAGGGESTERAERKAEEEDFGVLYQKFKAEYPEGRFDEAKAKPAFKALKPEDRKRALIRLRDPYLKCARWLDQGGKWIPFASNFLKDRYFDNDPPPLLQTARSGPQQLAPFDEVLKLMEGGNG
jgi:hypothetical protein